MLNWTPTPADRYRQCATELKAACYCEHKGTGPCFRGPVPPTPAYSALAERLRRERGRAQLALGFALVGILLWPLGFLAVFIARPSKCARAPWAYGLGFAESAWCLYIAAVILSRHL